MVVPSVSAVSRSPFRRFYRFAVLASRSFCSAFPLSVLPFQPTQCNTPFRKIEFSVSRAALSQTTRSSGESHIRESSILAPVRSRMQAAGLQCLKFQIAAASPDPQTRTFPGTQVSRKIRSPNLPVRVFDGDILHLHSADGDSESTDSCFVWPRIAHGGQADTVSKSQVFRFAGRAKVRHPSSLLCIVQILTDDP